MGKLTSSNDDLLDNKAEKAEVDNIKTLGIRPKDITDISKDAQNVYKMVFEQVVLVMVQARQIIRNPDLSSDFLGRMVLLDLLYGEKSQSDESGLAELRSLVSNMLEENKGSNDIISYLQSLGTEGSSKILRGIERDKVAFSSVGFENIKIKKVYSYYQSYICLYYPLKLFKKLLMVQYEDKESIKKRILIEIKRAVNDHDPFYPHNSRHLTEDQIQDFQKLKNAEEFSDILLKYTRIDKATILKKVQVDLAVSLGDWSSDIFAQISNPYYSEDLAKSFATKRQNFMQLFDIDYNAEEILITLNKKPVEALHKLNQLDDFFDSLQIGLRAKLEGKNYSRSYLVERKINNDNALSELSTWYENHSSGMVSNIDSVPKIIASIIRFDLHSYSREAKEALYLASLLKEAYQEATQKSNHKHSLKRTNKASPVRERNEIITYIITAYLYLDKDFKLKFNDSTSFDNFRACVKQNRADAINGLVTIPNHLMETWTVFVKNEDGSFDGSFNTIEQDKMMFRFKNIPLFFKNETPENGLGLVNQLIANQSTMFNDVPYPYMSAFPWPLWLLYVESLENNQKEIDESLVSEVNKTQDDENN